MPKKKKEEKEYKRKLKDEEQKILMVTRLLYDVQKLRIASGNRLSKGLKGVKLSERDKIFLASISKNLGDLEGEAEKMLETALKGIPIYEEWLVHQKGVGTRLSGFLIGEIEITKLKHPSSVWRYFGLDVENDRKSKNYKRAPRLEKGKKSHFAPLKKAKILNGLGGSLLKANPIFKNRYKTVVNEKGKKERVERDEKEWIPIPREEWGPWRQLYEDYKFRKSNQIVDVCMGCKGEGTRWVAKNKFGEELDAHLIKPEHLDPEEKKVKKKCWNCDGTGGPAPWGNDKKQRSLAFVRYMCKQFVLQMVNKWMHLEGLPLDQTYVEAKLGGVSMHKVAVRYRLVDDKWQAYDSSKDDE